MSSNLESALTSIADSFNLISDVSHTVYNPDDSTFTFIGNDDTLISMYVIDTATGYIKLLKGKKLYKTSQPVKVFSAFDIAFVVVSICVNLDPRLDALKFLSYVTGFRVDSWDHFFMDLCVTAGIPAEISVNDVLTYVKYENYFLCQESSILALFQGENPIKRWVCRDDFHLLLNLFQVASYWSQLEGLDEPQIFKS